MHNLLRRALSLALVLLLARAPMMAAGHAGAVTFNGLPVPGAHVSLSRGDRTVATVSDEDGRYVVNGLDDGVWHLKIEMIGFAPAERDIEVGGVVSPLAVALSLLPLSEMTTSALTAVTRPTPAAAARPESAPPQESRRTDDAPAPVASPDSFLLNGSVNNSAASAFAQMAAFGNNRRNGRSLYNGGLRVQFGASAFDSRPFSFSDASVDKPDYGNLQLLGTFGGPIRIPGVLRNGPQFFVGVQHVVDHSAASQSLRVPTALERAGDFSQSVDASGRAIAPVDPTTGLAFSDRRIPASRISPQAASLLSLYPQALPGTDRYQASTLTGSRQSSVQLRATQTLTRRDSLAGSALFNQTRTEATDFFAFTDVGRESTTNATLNWSHRVSQFLSFRVGVESALQANRMNPYFAGRGNVSGSAGILGNDQSPEQWGPPALTFGSGIATLASPAFADNHGRTDMLTGELFRNLGRHNVTFGGGIGRQQFDIVSQQDARGAFSFTGAATGSDIADLLLGRPTTASIATGNADKFLHGRVSNAYVNDDWRVSSSLTLNAGVRWEYEAPLVERDGRLSNIDAATDFSRIGTVVAGQTMAPVSGVEVPSALLNADVHGVQPRVGAAWRPVPGSSLVLRGGYGVYRNSNVYPAVSLLMAQQAPFSTSANLTSTNSQPLSLATAFLNAQSASSPTFGVDPDFRVGYAHNWQVSAQRDLPGSMTVLGTYAGTAGRHLLQEFLPNTYPAGGANPCASCSSGFTYLTSNGTSLRNSAQLQLRRRLRNGLTATGQYTLAKATDNASAFVPQGNPLASGANTGQSGASSGISGATLAQDWRDLDAEQGRSVFDRRHQLSVQFQFTSGMGVTGGALRSGLAASLLNGWTLTTDLSASSGAPLTPVVIAPIGGAGVVGALRPMLTGASLDATDGTYLNPAAYAVPGAGQYGNAGRNSVSGPSEFTVSGGLGRSFQWGERATAEWRLDATNLFNQVNYTGVNTVIGNPQFGLPTRAAAMRKVQASMRVRF